VFSLTVVDQLLAARARLDDLQVLEFSDSSRVDVDQCISACLDALFLFFEYPDCSLVEFDHCLFAGLEDLFIFLVFSDWSMVDVDQFLSAGLEDLFLFRESSFSLDPDIERPRCDDLDALGPELGDFGDLPFLSPPFCLTGVHCVTFFISFSILSSGMLAKLLTNLIFKRSSSKHWPVPATAGGRMLIFTHRQSKFH